MKVKMYKATNATDGVMCLFAVCGNKMAVSGYEGEDNLWLHPNSFGNFNAWFTETLDESRMINPVLIWESENED